MRENITKVAERGERLDQLQDKTGGSLSSVAAAGGIVRVRSWAVLRPRLWK